MRPNKEELHRLVDALPPGSMSAAHRILKNLVAGPRSCKRPRAVLRIVYTSGKTLIERVTAGKTSAGDPFLRAISRAPIDDEPLTAEDEDAAREGLEELASGKTISHEELRRRLLGQP